MKRFLRSATYVRRAMPPSAGESTTLPANSTDGNESARAKLHSGFSIALISDCERKQPLPCRKAQTFVRHELAAALFTRCDEL